MDSIILLDSGLLGMVTHPRGNVAEKEWLRSLQSESRAVLVPEIADFEVRRELLRAGQTQSIARLDLLIAVVGYEPITTTAMRRAAAFWADARRQGRPTAPDLALDADVILAGQAAALEERGESVVVATINVKHLGRFVDARKWQDIRP